MHTVETPAATDLRRTRSANPPPEGVNVSAVYLYAYIIAYVLLYSDRIFPDFQEYGTIEKQNSKTNHSRS